MALLSIILLLCLASVSLCPLRSSARALNEPFGQLLMTYYTGIGNDTLAQAGINALSLAFFDPTPLGQSTSCNFNDPNTPCVAPASGSGSAKNLAWILAIFNQLGSSLSANTAPTPGGKPTIFISFGGQSQGGACWDTLLNSGPDMARTFAQNAANLATSVYQTVGQSVYVGIDLDIEGTSTQLSNFGDFVSAYRQFAPYDTFPLQLCALSGLASPSSSDNFKVGLMQNYGPSQQGVNYLNMMVNNVDSSCADMEAYWLASALSFLPPSNRVLGIWGEIEPSWVIHAPGCTDGSQPLFPWIQQNEVGIGIWQWWSGPATDIQNLISQIRA